MRPLPTILKNPRANIGRRDNKIILHCQRCEYRALVDVKLEGITDWMCPGCGLPNRVTSTREDRREFDKDLRK